MYIVSSQRCSPNITCYCRAGRDYLYFFIYAWDYFLRSELIDVNTFKFLRSNTFYNPSSLFLGDESFILARLNLIRPVQALLNIDYNISYK